MVSVSRNYVLFFKQKTAYGMRISDWSSDVGSSDLTTACATAAFGKVSVVMIVAAASSQPNGGAEKAASNPASALSMGRGTPITPVEETNTSEGWQPRCPATRAAIASTAARPRLPVKALLLPAFTTSARALPSGRASRHHSTSGEGHLL